MPNISAAQYAQALFDAVSETNPKDQETVLDNFVNILHQNGDIARYPEIEAEFAKRVAKGNGIQDVTVITAEDMPNPETLIKDLNEFAGKRLNISSEVDPSLIGGMVIRAGDMLIDGSVKRQLNDLQKQLSDPELSDIKPQS